MRSYDELLEFAMALAREAGTIITEYFYEADRSDVDIKSDQTPVTQADKAVNKLVIDRVTAAFPEHGILAEEESLHEERPELWVCDPIDGTKGFILGVPTAMFSLAYVVDGVPKVGVLFDPFQDRLFSAASGAGAQLNGKPLRVSHRTELPGSSIAVSSRYQDLTRGRKFFDAVSDQGVKLTFVPGNVFRSSLVATGAVDAHIFPGQAAHDVAATKVIIEEAGGMVTDLDGHEQRYDGKIRGAVISNGRLHDDIISAIAEAGSDTLLGY